MDSQTADKHLFTLEESVHLRATGDYLMAAYYHCGSSLRSMYWYKFFGRVLTYAESHTVE